MIVVLLFFSVVDNLSLTSKLSTFTGGGSKNNLVQMRRTTNKRGKQAPAPPKRTSTKGDSESDLQDQTPDTDDSGAHSYPEVSTVSSLGCATGSFKRAPIMGNRGLEQRGKKTKTKETTPAVHVAALEVQNVRKAISRYGTLPKGARIGAYLESLKQSGMSTNEDTPQSVNVDQTESTPRSLSPRTNIRTQPQMIRSNSSGGVTTFHATHPPSSPTSAKLSRTRNITRNNTGDVRSSLRTFRASQNTTFRGGSPSRSIQPTLADLEFPPPPTDLPPPPEEFDGPIDVLDNTSIMTSSAELRKKIIPISPLTSKKIPRDNEGNENSDVSTLQPSVEEASSRFGVSLKKREPSTDSCNSFKDKDDVKDKSPQRTSLSLTSPSQDGKSPLSVESDVPIVGSPLEPLPPPPTFPEMADDCDPEKENRNAKENETSVDDNKSKKVFKNKLVKEMELKLVTEIKERADQKSKNLKESPLSEPLAVSGISHDPVAQLVTELSQSFNLERDRKEQEKITTCRKNSQGNVAPPAKPDNNAVSYVSQLKKIDPTKKPTAKDKPETNDSIIDFKSRLRKVDSGSDKKTEEQNQEDNEHETSKRESTASSDSGNLKIEESDDKRKSTGSISSLKKLWEPKEASDAPCNIQLSPKLMLKNNKNNEELISEVSPIETSDDSVKLGKSDKKIWPPSSEEKPLIPTKPPVKAVKPILAGRPAGSAIYATPIAPNSGNKPPIMAKPASLENRTPEDDVK
ncbi:tyrosine-protein kinase Abl, partial [Asbolus verrucosus]